MLSTTQLVIIGLVVVVVIVIWAAIYLLHVGKLFPDRRISARGHIRRHISPIGFWPEMDSVVVDTKLTETSVDLTPVYVEPLRAMNKLSPELGMRAARKLMHRQLAIAYAPVRKPKPVPTGSDETWFKYG